MMAGVLMVTVWRCFSMENVKKYKFLSCALHAPGPTLPSGCKSRQNRLRSIGGLRYEESRFGPKSMFPVTDIAIDPKIGSTYKNFSISLNTLIIYILYFIIFYSPKVVVWLSQKTFLQIHLLHACVPCCDYLNLAQCPSQECNVLVWIHDEKIYMLLSYLVKIYFVFCLCLDPIILLLEICHTFRDVVWRNTQIAVCKIPE